MLVRIVDIVADGVVQIFASSAVTDSNASFLEPEGIFLDLMKPVLIVPFPRPAQHPTTCDRLYHSARS